MNARPSRVLLTLNLGAVTNALKAVPAAVRINDRHMSSSPISNRAKMALPTRTLPQTSLGKQGIAARRLSGAPSMAVTHGTSPSLPLSDGHHHPTHEGR